MAGHDVSLSGQAGFRLAIVVAPGISGVRHRLRVH